MLSSHNALSFGKILKGFRYDSPEVRQLQASVRHYTTITRSRISAMPGDSICLTGRDDNKTETIRQLRTLPPDESVMVYQSRAGGISTRNGWITPAALLEKLTRKPKRTIWELPANFSDLPT